LDLTLLRNSVFGNYDFITNFDFESSIKSKYKLRKKDIDLIQIVSFVLFLLLVTIECFFQIENLLGIVALETCVFILTVRSIHFFLLSQYKIYYTKIETLGFYVLNEMLVILDSTKSMKDATKFIIISDYPFFSTIFKEALVKSHFGLSLKDSLIDEIHRKLSGEIGSIFTKIIKTWEDGKNLTSISKDNLFSKVNNQITKETESINTWTSLSTGLVFLGPPIVLLFLLISGNLNLFTGILLCFICFLLSIVTNPEKHTTIFSSNNRLNLLEDRKSLEFLTILANNLISGSIFARSLIKTFKSLNLNIHSFNFVPIKKIDYSEHYSDTLSENILDSLNLVFSRRTVELVSLTKKFSRISEKTAGKKLLGMVKELKSINGLISKGLAQMDASFLQGGIIQILGLFMLGFILGLTPFFYYLAIFLNNPLESLTFPKNTLYTDLTIIMTGLLISFFSNSKEKSINIRQRNKRILKITLIGTRFLFFLVVSIIVRSFSQATLI